jgi:hypothetical protein
VKILSIVTSILCGTAAASSIFLAMLFLANDVNAVMVFGAVVVAGVFIKFSYEYAHA